MQTNQAFFCSCLICDWFSLASFRSLGLIFGNNGTQYTMLASIFAALFPALAISVSTSLTKAMQSMYGFLTDFAQRESFY